MGTLFFYIFIIIICLLCELFSTSDTQFSNLFRLMLSATQSVLLHKWYKAKNEFFSLYTYSTVRLLLLLQIEPTDIEKWTKVDLSDFPFPIPSSHVTISVIPVQSLEPSISGLTAEACIARPRKHSATYIFCFNMLVRYVTYGRCDMSRIHCCIGFCRVQACVRDGLYNNCIWNIYKITKLNYKMEKHKIMEIYIWVDTKFGNTGLLSWFWNLDSRKNTY